MNCKCISLPSFLLITTLMTQFAIADEKIVDYAPQPWAPMLWPSAPPPDCPFPPSDVIKGVAFTRRQASYTNADTWYPSWASDGVLYSPFTDGVVGETSCISANGPDAHTGNAKITGDDPMNLQVTSLGTTPGSADPYGGRYPCGSLVYNGLWFYGTYCLDNETIPGYNWGVLGPFVGFRVSKDFGATWADCPWTPANPIFGESGKNGAVVKIGSPHFVDFGKNMEYSPDGKAYLVAHGAELPDAQPRPANLSWISGDQIYLARVSPTEAAINDPAQYEFFAGRDAAGQALWSGVLADARPIVEWNNRCGCVTMTWHPGLGRYLMCVTDGWPTVKAMNTYILESQDITGPWKMVTFMERFGEQAYFVNFPSKFISPDGDIAWLCYAGNFTGDQRVNPPGGRYAMSLQEVRLLSPPEVEAANAAIATQSLDPIKSRNNIALLAKAGATTSHSGYSPSGAVDGIVGGFPERNQDEWASQGEGAGAILRLAWDKPYKVDRVWMFDRPNTTHDQVMSGFLLFDDGAVIPFGALPDDARQGLEVSFPARDVTWMAIAVTSAKMTQGANIGFAEVAVFTVDEP